MRFPFSDPLGEYVWNDLPSDLPEGVESIWIYGGPKAELSAQRLTGHWKACFAIIREWDGAGRLTACDLQILGPVRTPRQNGGCCRVEIVAARLFPEYVASVLGVGVSEIADQDVSPSGHLYGAASSLLRLAGDEAVSGHQIADYLRAFMGHQIEAARLKHSALIPAARLVRARQGLVRLPEILSHIEVSERSLRREAGDVLGLSLKAYAGLVRHQAVLLRSLADRVPDWAGLAAEFGYADQAHLVREMKRYSGVSPARLHAERAFGGRIG